jgi:hypothetical protein
LLKNGVVIPLSSQTYNGTDLLYYNKTLSVQFATNDTLRVRTTCVLDIGDEVNVSESTINILNDVATTSPIELNDEIIVNNIIPKGIFQKDLFISVLKMFNLLVTEDKNKTNHLIIKPYIDFWTGDILDWSDKMDRSKAIKIKPMSEVNARYYNFKYKQDNDFYNEDYRKKFNEGYGDRIYDNGLEFAKDTESVEVIFAASPLFGTSTTDKVFPAIYKKSNENTKEDSMDHVVRIMQIKKVTSVASWNILNLATNLGSNTAYLYAGHLNNPTTPTDDINYGAPQQLYFNLTSGDLSNNLFNTYYSSYLAEITDKDSRLLNAYFNLTDLDIFNLDFSKFIYIDGGLYRINKVMDYAPENNELTKVDLLRVIEKEYIEQPPLPTTTSTTTTTTTAAPTTTTTTTAAPTTTTTTTAAPTTTTTTTAAPTTTTTTTAAPTTTTTTTAAPTTTTTTTAAPTTTTTTTAAPTTTTTTSTTTTTTTAAPTTTTTTTAAPTTTTTTTAAPTTTTTSTTTTTTTDPYDYYIADEIDCSNCSVVAADQRVSFPTGTSVTLNRYYRYVGFENDFTYYVKSVTTAGGAVLLELPSYTTCNAACGNTTTTSTTTTTTTPAPTTTTTSTTTTTTTPAPTTTTTSTTTTTTTLGYAFVDIANDTAGTDITNITINGVQVDGAVFPIVAGDGASATTTQTGGSRTIVVSYTNVGGDSVQVIDTASNLNCTGAGSTSRSFAGQVVGDGGTLFISMFDGSC